ncbi:riboflavin biosynthesis protein RibF [Synoicihabitans lomoniglobus]|uniref:Riboflavin biosynthesis protein n=1 Tax=Synoicihabitans lomoniglobus TaxID=2909285 RepID=A0AAF0CRI2_9BACT|nr:riboflavin biosynthesis protein RibF [Opitutaceae bacterium LMO-M01]WED66716.1 riboflavin biosynthesis protein RibF [Opitutaceae bacterium LMO-M01]
MKISPHIAGLAAASELPARPLHLAIGMFDGVHLGHRAVVEAAVISARRAGGLAAALTFDPHPSRLLRPDKAVPLLLPAREKARRLVATGLDTVITQPFTAEFAAVPADQFVPTLLNALPQLKAIYVGENWRFGRGRSGDVPQLNAAAKAHGLRVYSAPRVNLDGEPISSTRIRAALGAGDMDTVNALLGYTYGCEGTVTPGKRLGRSLGFPTLNLPWAPECAPRLGVYAVRAGSATNPGKMWNGVANFGLRPTVADPATAQPLLEVHLFETPPFDVGDELQVEWCAFLRAEQRFTGVDALREQIGRDRDSAREYFA